MMSAAIPMKTAGSGWTTARFSIQGSRGRTQQIRSGSTPLSSNQMQASVAVFPEPTTTYGASPPATSGSAFTGTTRAPSPTSNGGGVVAGISGDR
jgi:hypothetical protein